MPRIATTILTLILFTMLDARLASSQQFSKICQKHRGTSFAASFEGLGQAEAIDAHEACNQVRSRKKGLSLPGDIQKVKSIKSIHKSNFNTCNELTLAGLSFTASAFCNESYVSKWEANCCAWAD